MSCPFFIVGRRDPRSAAEEVLNRVLAFGGCAQGD
jgi:hypothetical protein